VFVVDDPTRFPDSMTATWSATDVSSLLASAFAPEVSNSSTRQKQNGSVDQGPNATIDVLLTFDQHGISNHPNHRSLYHGAVAFVRTLMKGNSGYSCPVALYTLTTTNLLRKYSGVLDSPLTMLIGALSNFRDITTGKASPKGKGPANRLLFVSSINQFLKARTAMTDGHKSQMVWFRWGWITLGRYMVVNDLKREKV
jgi:N-acetylglucosaminylphosphatidylinositol deacetylase